MRRIMSLLWFLITCVVAGGAFGSDVCPKGEKRLHQGEECIPEPLFNYLYCLEKSGGGVVEIIRKGSSDDVKDLEIQLGGKGAGVILKGEGNGRFEKAATTKATGEIRNKLDPTLAAKCVSFVNVQPPKSKSLTQPNKTNQKTEKEDSNQAMISSNQLPDKKEDGSLLKSNGTINQNMNNSPGGMQAVGDINIVVNPLPSPFILEQKLVSMNIQDQSRYKTQFLVTVGNPPNGNFTIDFERRPSSLIVVESPILQRTETRIYSSGSVPCKSYLISILTSNEVQEGDVRFKIRK